MEIKRSQAPAPSATPQAPAPQPTSTEPEIAPSPDKLALKSKVEAGGGSDNFADPTTYQKAVETTEGRVKTARERQHAAEATRSKVDTDTQRVLNDATKAHDTKFAEAVVPLNAAKQALALRTKELQDPIDETSSKLARARHDLDRATFPDKEELDAARANAHSEADRLHDELNRAQQSLNDLDADHDHSRQQLSDNEAGYAQTQRDLINATADLNRARSALSQAQWGAPSQWEVDQAASLLRQATNDVENAKSSVKSAGAEIHNREQRIHDLKQQQGNPSAPPAGDRPVPPPVRAGGGSDRPTPPSLSSATHAPASTTTSQPAAKTPAQPAAKTPAQPAAHTPPATSRPAPPSLGQPTQVSHEKKDAHPTDSRPTPPSVERPTPPAIDRPVPPSVDSGDSPELKQARQDLYVAQQSLASAQERLKQAQDVLYNAQVGYNDKSARWDNLQQHQAAYNDLANQVSTLQSNLSVYQNNIQVLQQHLRDLENARPDVVANRDDVTRAYNDATGHARNLDARPYQKGDPGKIASAQKTVDGFESQLKERQQAYTDGLKAPTAKLEHEQSVFDTTMKPFNQTVDDATNKRREALGQAESGVAAAKDEVQRAVGDLETLKDVPTTKRMKWGAPKWLGGYGFSVDNFWKNRPAV